MYNVLHEKNTCSYHFVPKPLSAQVYRSIWTYVIYAVKSQGTIRLSL